MSHVVDVVGRSQVTREATGVASVEVTGRGDLGAVALSSAFTLGRVVTRCCLTVGMVVNQQVSVS